MKIQDMYIATASQIWNESNVLKKDKTYVCYDLGAEGTPADLKIKCLEQINILIQDSFSDLETDIAYNKKEFSKLKDKFYDNIFTYSDRYCLENCLNNEFYEYADEYFNNNMAIL